MFFSSVFSQKSKNEGIQDFWNTHSWHSPFSAKLTFCQLGSKSSRASLRFLEAQNRKETLSYVKVDTTRTIFKQKYRLKENTNKILKLYKSSLYLQELGKCHQPIHHEWHCSTNCTRRMPRMPIKYNRLLKKFPLTFYPKKSHILYC